MRPAPLSWGAQIADHVAYVERLKAEQQVKAEASPCLRAADGRRTTARAEQHRAALLHALRDGRPHRFADLRAALPGHSVQGIYYLVRTLEAKGRIKSAP